MNVREWRSFRRHATAVVRERAIVGGVIATIQSSRSSVAAPALQAGTRALQQR
jgi:hypothetical protein